MEPKIFIKNGEVVIQYKNGMVFLDPETYLRIKHIKEKMKEKNK